jgi:lipopolysaccharide export LptBFGC system permease protein LptF
VAYYPALPVAAQTILGCVFMALLGLPAGLVFRRGRSGYAAVAVAVAGVVVLPALAGLAPLTPAEFAALLSGGVVGALMP